MCVHKVDVWTMSNCENSSQDGELESDGEDDWAGECEVIMHPLLSLSLACCVFSVAQPIPIVSCNSPASPKASFV